MRNIRFLAFLVGSIFLSNFAFAAENAPFKTPERTSRKRRVPDSEEKDPTYVRSEDFTPASEKKRRRVYPTSISKKTVRAWPELWQRHELSDDFIKKLAGEQRVKDKCTLLHIAMLMDEPEYLENKIQCVEDLIYAGEADLTAKNEAGDTPLHNWAMCAHSYQNEIEHVEKALHMRARELPDIINELVNSNGSTPLHLVCSRGLVNFLKFEVLIELGIPLDVQNRYGRTILHNLAYAGPDLNNQKAQIFGYLRKNRNDELSEILNIKDYAGKTALHIAIKNADKQMFDFLMQFRDIDFNATDNNGDTPLHYAAKNLNNSRLCGNYFITGLLRKNGLRKNVVNAKGKRAYRYVPDRFDRIKDRLKF